MSRRADSHDTLLLAENILTAKWTLTVLRVLGDGPLRFSGLRTAIPGVSAKILIRRLRGLEKVGVVCRNWLPPPADCQVYSLTEIGQAAMPILRAIAQWSRQIENN